MRTDRHAELREQHVASPYSEWDDEEVYPCKDCGDVHPCDTLTLLDEIAELRRGLDRIARNEPADDDDDIDRAADSDYHPDWPNGSPDDHQILAAATLARADAIGGRR